MKLEKLHFEVQLVEHCNLNCNNCVHYSPIAKEEYMDVDLYRRDLSRLSMLFGGEAEWIRLLGGEPLLHPEIIRIIKLTREFFSNTYISIVTNGILLLQMPDEFYLACRDYRIAISITQYPIRIKYNDLKEKLISYEVDYTIYSFAEIRKRMCRR